MGHTVDEIGVCYRKQASLPLVRDGNPNDTLYLPISLNKFPWTTRTHDIGQKNRRTLFVVLRDLFKHHREQIANTRFALVPTGEECLLIRVQTFKMAFL